MSCGRGRFLLDDIVGNMRARTRRRSVLRVYYVSCMGCWGQRYILFELDCTFVVSHQGQTPATQYALEGIKTREVIRARRVQRCDLRNVLFRQDTAGLTSGNLSKVETFG